MPDWKIKDILDDLHENRERQQKLDDVISSIISGTNRRLEMTQYIELNQAKYN